jgi:Ca-activated chloride channel homolog
MRAEPPRLGNGTGRTWLLTALALALGALLPLSAAPAQASEATKVLLLLDVSGSMNEKISSGGTKFEAAKRALKQVADSLPAGTQVGLRVYGSKIAEPKAQNPRACTDTELVMPIGPLDKPKMHRAVDSFHAKGETPIAHSLEQSVEDLGSSGKRVLVLISDGEETCAKDPCPTARKLAAAGVDLQFNAVGLAVNKKARSQLQCIAEAGDGAYYDASRAGDLSEALRKITQRALRPYALSGTRVKGTEEPAGAPELAAGQYVDAYDASSVPRYYRIPRTAGSTVTASIASLVNPFHGQNMESWTLHLTTESGKACDTTTPTASSFRSVIVLAGAVSSANGPSDGPCSTEPLLLSLQRKSLLHNEKSAPVEILVSTEPPIVNLSDLPSGLSSYDGAGPAVRATKPQPAILGGTSFTNSAPMTPGTWTDSPTTGETVFYRVHLETGQRLRVTVKMPVSRDSWHLDSADAVTPRLLLYAPSRVQLAHRDATLQGSSTVTMTLASPQVLVRNAEIGRSSSGSAAGTLDAASSASAAGDYYVALQLEPLQAYLSGSVIPVRLSLAVDGQPAGQPQYATAPDGVSSASASPGSGVSAGSSTAPPTDRSGAGARTPLLLAIGFGAALVAAGVFAAIRLVRTRRSAS